MFQVRFKSFFDIYTNIAPTYGSYVYPKKIYLWVRLGYLEVKQKTY